MRLLSIREGEIIKKSWETKKRGKSSDKEERPENNSESIDFRLL